MPLLSRPPLIRRQDRVDDPGKRVQLRARRRPPPPIPGRHRERQHLGYRPGVNPKTSRRFPLAHTFNLNRKTNPRYSSTPFIPRPLPLSDKGHLPPDFYSGATRLPGRFSSEGFLLRRSHARHTDRPGVWRRYLRTSARTVRALCPRPIAPSPSIMASTSRVAATWLPSASKRLRALPLPEMKRQ